MLFLLLQTFALMALAGLVGAIIGCIARRTLAPVVADDMAYAGAAAAPVVEASYAPQPAVARPAAPAPVAPPAPAAQPYDYPITTVGIPRGIPERIQPQIQRIELPPVPVAQPVVPAAVATAAAVKIVQPVVATPYTYPITTIGIPPGIPGPAPASVAPAAAVAAVRGDTARFAKALEGQVAPQPRPEPLRPELSGAGSAAPAPVRPAPPAAPAVPMQTAPQPAAPAITPVAVAAAGAVAAAATAARAAETSAAATAARPAAADDFTRIRAIDPDLQRRLNAIGIVRFADIAKLTPSDVARISQTLGLLGRVEQENWIEQAQILASGGDTYYSRRRQRGEIPPASPVWNAAEAAAASSEPAGSGGSASFSTGIAPSPQANPAPTAFSGATAAAAAAAAAAAGAAAMAASEAAASAASRNASVEPVKPARLSDAIRSNQGDGERPRSDLTGLRSVRSEALRPDVAATEGLRGGPPRPISQVDDLKRVRGIGVLIEKKLNSLGITTYEQIANWTNADIDRVSQILDFKGRIERESWVEQARILASGGHTEFSRRVDRGEA